MKNENWETQKWQHLTKPLTAMLTTWAEREQRRPILTVLAEDVVYAAASQVFMLSVFFSV